MPGGTLRVAVRDLATLDPGRASDPGARLAAAQVFDSLTSVDPATGHVQGAAARSWSASADGRVWSFLLRKARFHDGSAVVAADFKRAFDRVARPGSDVAFQLEMVAGFQQSRTGARALAGVSAPAPYRLVIRLASPFWELPAVLSHPALAPLPRRAESDPRGFAARPVGNGPFRLLRFSPGRTASLERYDDHPGGTSYLDAVEFRVVRDVNDGWRAFLAGEVDVAEVPSTILAGEGGRYARAGFSPYWAAVYYGPNLRLAKYARADVRRAMSMAINREAVARIVYGGAKDPATGLLPRGLRGYRPGACGPCAADRERARAILSAAFPRAPLSVAIDHLDAPLPRAEARAIAADLRGVGVRASLRAHGARAYESLLRAGKQDFAELGWLSEVSSPDWFLAQQLRGGSRNNPTGFADRRFDYLIDRARATKNEGRRLAEYRRAESRALDLMPLIPIVFFRNRTAVAARVRGFALDGAGVFDASAAWIAPAA